MQVSIVRQFFFDKFFLYINYNLVILVDYACFCGSMLIYLNNTLLSDKMCSHCSLVLDERKRNNAFKNCTKQNGATSKLSERSMNVVNILFDLEMVIENKRTPVWPKKVTYRNRSTNIS